MKWLLLLSVALAAFMLLLGCTGTPPNNPQAPAAQPPGSSQQPTQPANPQPTAPAAASGCTSPYDGTWKGVVSDSGDLEVTRIDSKGVPYTTDNPFTASYDFEMTIKCNLISTGPETGAEGRYFNITHVKASHPIFNCANGCTPPPDNGYVFIGNDGSGSFWVGFPNGAFIQYADHEGRLQASPDGKTMQTFVKGATKWKGETIGDSGSYEPIETYNCQQYGGEGICVLNSILPNTIILTKVG